MMGLRNHGGKSISQTAPKAREQALVGNFLNNATWNDYKVGNLAKKFTRLSETRTRVTPKDVSVTQPHLPLTRFKRFTSM